MFCWEMPALSQPVTAPATDTADDGIDCADDTDGADDTDADNDTGGAAKAADDASGGEASTAGGDFDAVVSGSLHLVDIISLGIII